MELRSFKVRSIQVDHHQDIAKEFFLKPNPNGAIGQQYIIEYQTAIDELMKTSRYTTIKKTHVSLYHSLTHSLTLIFFFFLK